ncbi:hypothetical protein F383_38523 [Gossypium arboreum]|uniref:Uncharacterized protein n=1 Tax=Gossypium arboreum TaxID=29729 RepID=A0A0B0MJM1_GOSAR|nr:hypothetical protein F383_38523 [Gossypium arboreum]
MKASVRHVQDMHRPRRCKCKGVWDRYRHRDGGASVRPVWDVASAQLVLSIRPI